MLRQGDLLFIPVEKLPDSASLSPRGRVYHNMLVLATGEKTGHAHVIKETSAIAALFGGYGSNETFLQVKERPVNLVHEEHKPLALMPGEYKVIRQREHSADKPQYVQD